MSAISVMLAAYGFFYNAFKARVEAGQEVGSAKADHDLWQTQLATVERARTATRLLAAVPVVVWLLFLSKVISQIEAAIDVRFALARYSTLDVVFFVLANAWLLIAISVFAQERGLSKAIEALKAAEPPRG